MPTMTQAHLNVLLLILSEDREGIGAWGDHSENAPKPKPGGVQLRR